MKKVINTPPPADTIPLSEVLQVESPLVAFLISNGEKITLVPAKYRSELYFARCASGWESGNGYDPFEVDQKSIQDWAQFFRECHPNSQMFLFDSPQELFKWLAE